MFEQYDKEYVIELKPCTSCYRKRAGVLGEGWTEKGCHVSLFVDLVTVFERKTPLIKKKKMNTEKTKKNTPKKTWPKVNKTYNIFTSSLFFAIVLKFYIYSIATVYAIFLTRIQKDLYDIVTKMLLNKYDYSECITSENDVTWWISE